MNHLILGAGTRRTKLDGTIIYLDNNRDCKPDVLWDLRKHPLPFESEEFDKIHAHQILEHLAQQGDYEFFFKEFEEYYRILKRNGQFIATVPMWDSIWAWGDPSHKRVIQKETLVFLDRNEYKKQIGNTSMSDFRSIYCADFKLKQCDAYNGIMYFVLEKK